MLEATIAQALAGWEGHTLRLDGIQSLDAATARALASWDGYDRLDLGALRQIDLATAQALGSWEGDFVQLTGLLDLEPDAAAALACGAPTAIVRGAAQRSLQAAARAHGC